MTASPHAQAATNSVHDLSHSSIGAGRPFVPVSEMPSPFVALGDAAAGVVAGLAASVLRDTNRSPPGQDVQTQAKSEIDDPSKIAALEFDALEEGPELMERILQGLDDGYANMRLAGSILRMPKPSLVAKLQAAADAGNIQLFAKLACDLETTREMLTGLQEVLSSAIVRIAVGTAVLSLDPRNANLDCGPLHPSDRREIVTPAMRVA